MDEIDLDDAHATAHAEAAGAIQGMVQSGARAAHTPADKIDGREPKPVLYNARRGRTADQGDTPNSLRGPKLLWRDIMLREKRNA